METDKRKGGRYKAAKDFATGGWVVYDSRRRAAPERGPFETRELARQAAREMNALDALVRR